MKSDMPTERSEPRDTVATSAARRGILAQPPAMLTVEELDGILPEPEREVDDDFGNLIREATRDAMERVEGPALWSPGGESGSE